MNKKALIEFLIQHFEDMKPTAAADERVAIERQILMLRFLPNKDLSVDDVIVPSALVKVRTANTESYVFMVPSGGALVTSFCQKPVQVLTPDSPLGDALVGKKAGEVAVVQMGKHVREYQVLELI